jgi:hypothetical protein
MTISSEAVSAGDFLSSLESRFGAKFTPRILIMPRISLPSQKMLFFELNGLEKRWRPGYRGTDVNRLSN